MTRRTGSLQRVVRRRGCWSLDVIEGLGANARAGDEVAERVDGKGNRVGRALAHPKCLKVEAARQVVAEPAERGSERPPNLGTQQPTRVLP